LALSIKDPETDTLARRLAAQTGLSLTEAIKDALQHRLAQETRKRQIGLSQRLLAIGRRCSKHMKGPLQSSDHGDLLYDEIGLPR
jgi:antitoxin VapB